MQAQPLTAEALASWLVARVAEAGRLDPRSIDVDERFSRYGLDSLGAGRLIAQLSELVGRPLSPTLVWEAPTLRALVRHLTGHDGGHPHAPGASERSATSLDAPEEHDAGEPIAIVGMACRFPGAPDPEAFWRLLRSGVDAISEVPRDRWDAAALFDPDTAARGKINTRWGGFLAQVDQFDPQFFGISPREAVQMDPQQRLVLELAWEALEDAGIPPPELVESRTGVYVGALFVDHALLQDRAGREAITTHSSTGGAACIIANRVSYALGLQGPSLAVDTACSSSLVAVHLACQSLRSGESDTALAGGVNLMLVPETTMGFSRLGAMSPDGRCRAFGAGANGYVRSEGAGLVVLKRLSDALRDGGPIYAVVRGSAVNNDGASNGLTAPNPRAQHAVLRAACRSAGLAPADVHYVEAHGTGTPLGDPIEASGLGAVFGAARAARGDSGPLLIGSAKTNVGHLEAAAGIVGLIKVALAMKHDLLPPSLHFEEPNPRIDFTGLRLEVVTRPRPWPAAEGAPRRAGVSSFGYGGTNSHVILESLPRPLSPAPNGEAPEEPRRAAWVFSGQGSQWVGMGRGLVLSEPAFRAALERCDHVLRPLLGWSVFDEILRGAPRAVPERIDIMWPTLFAFQVALAALLRSLGVAPAAVIGHSIGEVAAAHVAGALSLEDAARVIAGQARLVQRRVGTGGMLLAAVRWDEAQGLAASSGGRVDCAIAASPMATVLTGDPAALGALSASLAGRGVFVRPVDTSVPVHGPRMAFLADELPGLLAGLRPRRAEIPIVSAMTGEPVRGEDLDVAYWARQLGEPVRFAQGTARLLEEGYRLFVEISPHPIVKQSIEESVRHLGLETSAAAVATLLRGEEASRSLREALGVLAPRGTPGERGDDRVHVLPVSGQVEGARSEAARRLAELVEGTEGLALDDLCYTASARRTHHRARGVVVARGRAELLEGLRALAGLREHASVRTGLAPLGDVPGVVFVFPGQGSQWVGMGRQLLAEEPVFRAELEACDAAILHEAGFSVLEELAADEGHSRLAEIDVVQPALFAVEVSLAALWRAWGVEPDCVVGHSMGEVAAAHVAGILSLEDAVKVICRRSRLLRRVSGKGAMGLVELALPEAEKALAGYEDRLSVAVSNGPRSTVLSGDPAALEEVLAALEKQGVFCRRVKVDVASHSPQVDPLQEDLRAALDDVRPRAARLAMRSTVTGERVLGTELDAGYWVRNLRAPVLFSTVTQRLMKDGHGLFVEMSPHPILLPAVEENLREVKREGVAIASVRRSADERRSMLDALGALYVHGHPVDWRRVAPEGARFVSLPTYPWQHERFWLEQAAGGSAARSTRSARGGGGEHPLIGAPLASSLHVDEHLWEQWLSVADLPYLEDHRVEDAVVFPGAGYVEMALAAGKAVYGAGALLLEEMRFERMLALPPGSGRLVQVTLVKDGSERGAVTISSRAEGETEWTRHAYGKLRLAGGAGGAPPTSETLSRRRERCATMVVASEHYARMIERGLPYGARFQGVERLWMGEGEALGQVRLPEELSGGAGAYGIHPALLDACIQVAVTILPRSAQGTFVPVGAGRVRIDGRVPAQVWVHARLAPPADGRDGAQVFDLAMLDEDGRVIAEMNALRLAPLETRSTGGRDGLDDGLYTVVWREKALPPIEAQSGAPAAAQGAWLVVLDARGTAAALAARLRERGHACLETKPGGSYERVDDQRWQVDVTQPAQLDRLFAEAFGKQRACRGVIHCAGLDAAPPEKTSCETLQVDLRRGTVAAIRIAQAIVRRGFRDTPRLILVTCGAQAVTQAPAPMSVAQAPLWGLGRTIALEHPELECTRIDLSLATGPDTVDRLFREVVAGDGEDQIALRAEGRFVARLARGSFDAGEAPVEHLAPAAGRPYRLEIREPGVLDRLSLREVERRSPGPGEVEIEVEASGLNFLDVMKAMGIDPRLLTGPVVLGGECAGTIVAVGAGVTGLEVGREVLAATMGSFASHVTVPAAFVAPKSGRLSFEQAATIPLVFMTVYWSLHHVARLSRGERILIHSASGGTGLAAIQYARAAGAEVFATAGNAEKRAFLRSLGVEHVMDSRSLAFADEVLASTGGRGVDVVLNSLEGEALLRSLDVLAPYGRFLEIGKKDIYQNRRVGLLPFRKCLSYTAIDLAGMATDKPELFAGLLREVMARFEDGTFTPLPVQVFGANEAQDAFRRMAQAKHTGKIAVQMKDPAARIAPREVRRDEMASDGSYLITGGLGGLGLRLARWMVSRGARHLALVGRSAPTDAAREAIRAMEESGAEVRVLRGDVSRLADVEGVLGHVADRMPPLRGVVHAAGVLDDRTLIELGEEQFWTPIRPKVFGAWNLHVATRALPLDFFVMYSSVASLLGSPGQTAYAAANAFLDALAHARAADGLPAMSIQWGPFSEVGLAALGANRGQRLSHQGMQSFTPQEGIELFSRALRHPRAEVGLFRISFRQWIESHPQATGMRYLTELDVDVARPPGTGTLRETLERTPPADRQALVAAYVLDQLGRVVRVDPSRLDPRAPFKSLGMDSLLSLEMRNRLETGLGLRLSTTVLFTFPNPAALTEHLLASLAPAPGPPTVTAAAPLAPPAADLNDLSGEDLLAMLDEELSLAKKSRRAT